MTLAPLTAPAAPTFTKVTDTTTTAPGQSANFSAFQTPALEGNTAVFKASYGTGTAGLYSGTVSPASTSRVADYSLPTPDAGTNFSNFGDVPSLSGNRIAFFARATSSSGPQAIYAGTAGSTTVTTVANSSTSPTGGGVTGAFTGFGGNTGLSGTRVVFTATIGTPSGVYTGSTTATGAVAVADTSLQAPGQGLNFTSFGGQPGISGTTVLFRGTVNNGTSNLQGLYTGTAGTYGSVRVADTNTAVPGRAANFSGSSAFPIAPTINNNNIGFRGGFTLNSTAQTGIYRGTVGSTLLSAVADTLTAVPGRTSLTFTGFGGLVSLDTNGDLAFLGNYTGGSGIFVSSNNTIAPIVSAGDTLFGSTITTLTLGNDAFDASQIIFGYTLASGTSGIAVVNLGPVVPEPSTWALLGVGVMSAGVLMLRRRMLA